MPAYRLTADCIWNAFRSSSKRHLILTGSRSSGKTTLLSALFPQPLPGITTWAEPRKAVYLTDNRTRETVEIGRYRDSLPGIENKMVLCSDALAALGIPVLNRCMQGESEWVTIDEIGYLETDCTDYQNAIRELLAQKHVAAVVRKQELPFLQELCGRQDVFLVDLDDPFGNTGCVIMASGLGRRFGGNKLMAGFHGEPMITRILDATEGIFARRVVVTRHEAVAALCEKRGIHAVLHDLPYRNDTVRLGLKGVGEVDNCMFCPADQPLLRQETIASLVLAAVNDPESVWRTGFEGTFGSPVLFPKWTFPELLTLPQGKGGGAVIKKYPERLRTVSVRDMYELKDVDSPEDLSELLER